MNLRIRCSYCDTAKPVVFCSADDAILCFQCDQKIHVNPPLSHHKRVLLSFASISTRQKCDNCPGETGHFLCLQDRSLLCRECDLAQHGPNSVAAAHVRIMVMGARVGEIDVPNCAPVNHGTACSPIPPAGFQYRTDGTSSSLPAISPSIPPAGFQYSMDSRATKPAEKGGETASSKKAGKRILGWDRTSPPPAINSIPYPPTPHKRCAGMHSLYPQPQWTGTSTPNHVNPSSPMPSMSLVLKPTHMPTPRFSPSDSSPIQTTSHTNIPPNQQMGFYGQSNEIPANTALDRGEAANPVFQANDILNSLPGNSNLNPSYYPNQVPFGQPQDDDFLDPLLCNMDIASLLSDDYGVPPVHRDDSEWWRYLQAAEELLKGEIEDGAHDRSASQECPRPSSSQPPPSVPQQHPSDSHKGKRSSFHAPAQYKSFPSTSRRA